MSQADDIQAIIDILDSGIKAIMQTQDAWWKKLWAIVILVVPEVEKFKDIFVGSEKKTIALDLIVKIYFKYINISWIPDTFEEWIVRAIAGVAIDKAVAQFNKSGTFTHA